MELPEVSILMPYFAIIRAVLQDAVYILNQLLLCGAVSLVGRIYRLRNPVVSGRHNSKLATPLYTLPVYHNSQDCVYDGFYTYAFITLYGMVNHKIPTLFQVACLIT